MRIGYAIVLKLLRAGEYPLAPTLALALALALTLTLHPHPDDDQEQLKMQP